ncbi:MAG: phage tail tube protein, partial [Candidatus Nitrosotenuis sp.]
GTVASPAIYPSGGLGQGKAPKVSESITMRVGFNTSENSYVTGHTDYKVRSLKGCVLNSLSLSTAVGDVVNVSADFTYGDEDAPNTVFTAPTIVCGNPYTFAHAVLKLKYAGSDLEEIPLVQDTDLTFALNNELLYSLNSHQAVDSFRRILDITGRFKMAWYDWKIYERVLAQIGKGSSGSREPRLATAAEPVVEVQLEFTNGTKYIKIYLTGVSITDLGISGIEPVEPVYQEVNYKAKAAKVEVVHT